MPDIKSGEIEVKGLADLEKMLLGLSNKIAKNVMWGAMRAGAVVIQRAAKAKCPVSSEAHWLGAKGTKHRVRIQPGELKRKGIRVRRLREGSSEHKITVAAYASKKYWYAHFVEYGHHVGSRYGDGIERANYSERVLTKKGYWQTKHKVKVINDTRKFVAARPFMRPAWDENKERALEAARDFLKERIPKELNNVK